MTQRSGAKNVPPVRVLPLDTLGATFQAAITGPDHLGSPEVIWSDGGARILLHVAKLQVRTSGSAIIVAVDTESQEFGVAPLIVRFVFGSGDGPASLVASTDAAALGHPQVGARWGELFRDVIWAAITRLIDAQSQGKAAGAIHVLADSLHLTVQESFSLVDLARAHRQDMIERGLRAGPRAAGSRTAGPSSAGPSSAGPSSAGPGEEPA